MLTDRTAAPKEDHSAADFVAADQVVAVSSTAASGSSDAADFQQVEFVSLALLAQAVGFSLEWP